MSYWITGLSLPLVVSIVLYQEESKKQNHEIKNKTREDRYLQETFVALNAKYVFLFLVYISAVSEMK